METTLALAYIEHILLKPGVALIEVWDRVLYVRMKKGCGRNYFMSKRELEYSLPVYYFQENYRNVSKQFHPDCNIQINDANNSRDIQTVTSKTEAKSSKYNRSRTRIMEELQSYINTSKKQQLSVNTKDRNTDARHFTRNLYLFTKFTSSKVRAERDKFAKSINEEIHKAGFHNCSFADKCEDNENQGTLSKNIIEEFLREFEKAVTYANERAKAENPEFYQLCQEGLSRF